MKIFVLSLLAIRALFAGPDPFAGDAMKEARYATLGRGNLRSLSYACGRSENNQTQHDRQNTSNRGHTQ
jgi:hypothetical protein